MGESYIINGILSFFKKISVFYYNSITYKVLKIIGNSIVKTYRSSLLCRILRCKDRISYVWYKSILYKIFNKFNMFVINIVNKILSFLREVNIGSINNKLCDVHRLIIAFSGILSGFLIMYIVYLRKMNALTLRDFILRIAVLVFVMLPLFIKPQKFKHAIENSVFIKVVKYLFINIA